MENRARTLVLMSIILVLMGGLSSLTLSGRGGGGGGGRGGGGGGHASGGGHGGGGGFHGGRGMSHGGASRSAVRASAGRNMHANRSNRALSTQGIHKGIHKGNGIQKGNWNHHNNNWGRGRWAHREGMWNGRRWRWYNGVPWVWDNDTWVEQDDCDGAECLLDNECCYGWHCGSENTCEPDDDFVG